MLAQALSDRRQAGAEIRRAGGGEPAVRVFETCIANLSGVVSGGISEAIWPVPVGPKITAHIAVIAGIAGWPHQENPSGSTGADGRSAVFNTALE